MKTSLMRPLALGVMIGVLSGPALAEIPANVMAQFSQLTPSQQEAIAAQYGMDISQLRSQSGNSQGTESTMQQTLAPRAVNYGQNSQRMPLMPGQGGDQANNALQPFGYNVFAGQPTSQTPLADIPVPDDYIIGPGDELRVQMFGKENASYRLKVNRDGNVEFPKLGPINVAGLSFDKARESLQSRISEQFIGIESAISMGSLRTMQVFVMGDAYRPGAYNVNALTTVTQALQVAGGIDTVGSLRKIQVKRAGQAVQNVDLYKMLIWGDTQQDIRLRAGDTIFIPSKGTEVQIDGLVKRPGIYELTGPAAISSVLQVAGGLKAEALREVTVTRRGQNGMQVFDLTLGNGRDNAFTVKDGDHIEAKPTTTEFSQAVSIKGAVVREGAYSVQAGTRVSQLLKDQRRDLKSSADLDYALVVREINPRHDIEVLQFNLGRAIAYPGDLDDIALQPRDQVLVFEQQSPGSFVDPSLQRGAGINNRTPNANWNAQMGVSANNGAYVQNGMPLSGNGQDASSGNYAADNSSTTSQQVTAVNAQQAALLANGNSANALQLQQAAALQAAQQKQQEQNAQVVDQATGAVVTQRELNQKNQTMDLNDLSQGTVSQVKADDARQKLLKPIIERLKAQASQTQPVQIAEIRGAVKFPGVYPIARNMTQAELIAAAGGLKETAYAGELSRVDEMADGQLSINHQKLSLAQLAKGAAPRVQSKDSLNVFANPDWRGQATVQLFGEVKYPGTYTVRRGETLGQLLQRAGGVTQFGYAKGGVFARESLRRQEADRLSYLKDQLQQEIATMTLRRQTSIAGRASSPAEASALVGKLESTQAIGRMTIDLPSIVQGDKHADIMLENGDRLYVPPFRNVISVAGQVQMPTSHVFDASLSVQDYLDRSGGTKKQADNDRIYVIKANGSVMMPDSNYWYSRHKNVLEPGDSIIVPVDSDYLDNLSTWSTATQMMYQLGVAWAAIKP